ncbi:MAG TPA: GNAT family N-acetyltransferase [Kofleriaceae bacterium]
MIIRSLALQTELALAALRGKVIDRGDYIVVETPDDPGYYYGNLLVLPAPPQVGEVTYWTRRFADELGKNPAIKHVTFWWDGTTGDAGASAELSAADFTLEPSLVMVATSDELVRRASNEPAAWPIRALSPDETPAIAEVAYAVGDRHDETYRAFYERRAARHRDFIVRGLAKFWGAFDGAQLVASLGLVELGALARFQDVQTLPAYRARGLASALLAAAAAHAVPHAKLVIMPTPGGASERVYSRAGFRIAERTISACRYPR